jgi:hypothetical protein
VEREDLLNTVNRELGELEILLDEASREKQDLELEL